MASGGASSEPQTAKRAAVQAAVLEAAGALLAEGVSYTDLNIERIATRAGISRTAFYFYFRDKRELLLRLTEDVTDRFYAQGDIWYSGGAETAPELRRALANISELYREHGAVVGAVIEAAATDEEVGAFWHSLVDRFVDATAQRIETLQREGRTVVAEDARASAFALCWMIERTLHQQLARGAPFDEDVLVDALTGIFMRAVYGAQP